MSGEGGYALVAPGQNAMDFDDVQSVAVIGAGVAGLQMTRALLAHGLKVRTFDKAPAVGGLWRENYHSYGVQVPKEFYEFPDFPSTMQRGEYPTGAQTQAYIESYAKHYGLLPHIQFNTEVVGVSERTDGKKGYTFGLRENGMNLPGQTFDFVVVATGMYSQQPNMPAWTKALNVQGDFKGKVIHSSAYLDQATARGKKVVVIGAGKSAIDITNSVSEVASEPPTMLFRTAHWSTPRWIAGLIPFQYVFLSRLGQALVSWYKGPFPSGAPCYCCVCSWILFPIMWLAFRLVELIFAIQRGHWGEYRPQLDVVADFYGCAAVLDTTFISKWRSGSLKGKKGEVASLCTAGVKMTNGEIIEADLVICATGFTKTYDYLPPSTVKGLDIQPDGLYLYRHCLPAAVRDMRIAFCGSEVATISNIMTHGIHAEYISRMISGRMVLPTKEVMEEECERMKAWKRSWMPETSSRANQVLLHQVHYHDQLLTDMGISTNRKCCLAELFCPYGAGDYDDVISAKQALGP